MDLGMSARIRAGATALGLVATFLAAPAAANTIWLGLDNCPALGCDEVWLEQQVPMWVTTTAGEVNFPIGCDWDPDAELNGVGCIHLRPGRLVIDISGVPGVDLVYMDVHNVQGDVRARMMRGTEQLYYHALSVPGDLLMALPVFDGDTVQLSVADGYVTQVRLVGVALPDERTSFGAVKVLYRR